MPRIIIKGGVWRNTEVSSILPAKNCAIFGIIRLESLIQDYWHHNASKEMISPEPRVESSISLMLYDPNDLGLFWSGSSDSVCSQAFTNLHVISSDVTNQKFWLSNSLNHEPKHVCTSSILSSNSMEQDELLQLISHYFSARCCQLRWEVGY